MHESWDYLIVLDACRYDYFERLYQKSLSGKLSIRLSPATCTRDWLARVFDQYYGDCIYVSANAYVSTSPKRRGLSFEAVKHFYKVEEVWGNGWSNDHGTVMPDRVNLAALRAISKNKGKRCIIHYMQPHYPYVGVRSFKMRSPIMHKYIWVLRNLCTKLLGNDLGLRIAHKIAPNDEEYMAKQIGLDALRKQYELNLLAALSSVSTLLKHLQGTIVVTSDHGELLGENDLCGHPCGLDRVTELRAVPWLEIQATGPVEPADLTEAEGEVFNPQEADLMMKRLRAFGYA
jgi:hypothetical protein